MHFPLNCSAFNTGKRLIHKAPSESVADDSLIFFFFFFLLFFFSEKRKFTFDVNYLLRQKIHMKCLVLFSLKNNIKYIKLLSAAVVIGTLRVDILAI